MEINRNEIPKGRNDDGLTFIEKAFAHKVRFFAENGLGMGLRVG